MKRLGALDLRGFLFGQTLHAFDPDLRERIATVCYETDGNCFVTFVDGTRDRGRFNLDGDIYSTCYEKFRSGETNAFYLVEVAPQITQAFHKNGKRAFLQSPLLELKF